jgi:predicted TIM-barrel fold metal-dependent hydrolase
MAVQHLTREELAGKTIDAHAHLGFSLRAFASLGYPYAQSLEDLYYRQRAGNVDVNIVFPFTPDLYFEPHEVAKGNCVPDPAPISPVPYGLENRMVLREVFGFFPELSHRFLPFLSVDPGRAIPEQVADLTALADEYPIYGLKLVPVFCQSPVTALLEEGRPLLEFARARNLPVLLHTTTDPHEEYSRVDLTFRVVEANPDLRFCLAHCIGFHRGWLDRAAAMPNVFFDTAALKIQVQMVHEGNELMAHGPDLFPADYADHTAVMRALSDAYPDTLIWGTDSPAYTYMIRRKQAEDYYVTFNLKGSYEDEVAALNALPESLRQRVCNTNTLRFVFGDR